MSLAREDKAIYQRVKLRFKLNTRQGDGIIRWLMNLEHACDKYILGSSKILHLPIEELCRQ